MPFQCIFYWLWVVSSIGYIPIGGTRFQSIIFWTQGFNSRIHQCGEVNEAHFIIVYPPRLSKKRRCNKIILISLFGLGQFQPGSLYLDSRLKTKIFYTQTQNPNLITPITLIQYLKVYLSKGDHSYFHKSPILLLKTDTLMSCKDSIFTMSASGFCARSLSLRISASIDCLIASLQAL